MATDYFDLVDLTRRAVVGDSEARALLYVIARKVDEFVKIPVGSIERNIRQKYEEANHLEAQGRLLEADALRAEIVISGYLTFLPSPHGTTNLLRIRRQAPGDSTGDAVPSTAIRLF